MSRAPQRLWPLAVHALSDERLPHVFRGGIDQLRTVRVACRLDGASGQPPVKRFAVVLRQVGNKVRRITEAAKLSRRPIEWSGEERT
jgi:hypothetical protein